MPLGFYILCSIFGSLILCNLIVQTLNDVFTTKKKDSEKKYWQIANNYIAAIEMDACIDYETKYQDWSLQPYFSLIGVLAAAALFAAVAAVGGVTAGLLCTVAVIIVTRFRPAFISSIQGKRWYQDWIQPYFSFIGFIAAAALFAAVAAVGGVTEGLLCTVYVFIVISSSSPSLQPMNSTARSSSLRSSASQKSTPQNSMLLSLPQPVRSILLEPYFSFIGVLAAAALFYAVAAVGGVTAGLLCTVAIVPLAFLSSIQEKWWFQDWILQPYFSLTIDPDSIYQRITSLRLERHFRANHLQSN
jgi:hypothetical protein